MELCSAERDGFNGFFHPCDKPFDPLKAVIVLGGSEGTDEMPMRVGRRFARQGIAALGVRYFGAPGTPQDLVHVPVETVELAVEYLQNRGFKRIAVYGISKGAELGLLAASLIPDIRCVVALSPSHCVYAGLMRGKRGKKRMAAAPSFTWRDHPLPYARSSVNPKVLPTYLRHGELILLPAYEAAVRSMPPEAAIAVERIAGPILLLSPDRDTMWPSQYSCTLMMSRLREKNFAYPVEHISYLHASHILVPIDTPQTLGKIRRAYKVERTHPEECRQSRQDAWVRTLRWLRTW